MSAILPPSQRVWWKQPLDRLEGSWIVLSLIWCLIMFFMMPYWHIYGKQNLANEAYRTTPDAYTKKTQAMVDKYTVRKETAREIPVVRPPAGSDVYLIARLWQWWPLLELEAGKSYRVHLMSMDWLHGFSLQPENINIQVHPGSIEVAQRVKGYNKGLFEWLRKAPWGNPVFSGMFMSLIGFGFLGGISGVVLGTEQLNLIMHNTLYVPGHFHATVVIGTTLAFMALTYFLIPVMFRREVMFPKLAQWQPYLFGIGMSGFALFMMGAGTLGVPRRHWDITMAGNLFSHEWPGTAYLMIGLFAIFGILAVIGGAAYLLITVCSVFIGKKIETPGYNRIRAAEGMAAPAPVQPVAAAITGHGGSIGAGGMVAPGTFVLAMVLLVSFVLYYFVNWKYLSQVWPLS